MRMDGHTHICFDQINPIASVSNVIKEMDRCQLEQVAAFPLTVDFTANYQLAMAAKTQKRIIPLAFIDAGKRDSLAQLRQCIEEYGMCGLKLHPTLCRYHIDDPKKVGPLFAYCDKHHLNIVIHCTTDDPYVHPYRIASMAQHYPNATFQIAHMGAIWGADAAIEVAQRCPNIYLDTGIASFNAIRRAIDQVPNKVIMGADFPFYTYASEQQKITDAFRYSVHATEKTILEQALGKNCATLYADILKKQEVIHYGIS